MNKQLTKAEARPVPPMVRFKHELETIAQELPGNADIPIEKMKSAIIVAVQKQPDLLKADRSTLWQAARSCAADGLLPDGREAAFVLFSGAVQYLPMIGGIYKRMRNSGEVRHVRAEIVCKNDDFAVWIDEETAERRFRHTYDVFAGPAERGEPIGAYAVAGLKDGTIEFEPMGAEEIDRVRRVSRSQKGAPSGVWATWWDQMWKKTVIRRLAKRLPVNSENVRFLDRDESGQVIDEQPLPMTPPAEERRSRSVAYVDDDPVVDDTPHDAETGEITDSDVSEAEVVDGAELPEEIASTVDRIIDDLSDCNGEEETAGVLEMWGDQIEQIATAWPDCGAAMKAAAEKARKRKAAA